MEEEELLITLDLVNTRRQKHFMNLFTISQKHYMDDMSFHFDTNSMEIEAVARKRGAKDANLVNLITLRQSTNLGF